MEMRAQHLRSHILQPATRNLPGGRQRRQSLHEAATLMLNAICGILADLVHERNRLDGRACFEKHHWLDLAIGRLHTYV